MERKEYIKVYIKVKNGKTVCICKHSDKKCDEDCEVDVVMRDRYLDWESTFQTDRYGGKRKG